jgi:hypothetical protein
MQIDSLEAIEDEIQCCRQNICYIVAKYAGYWRTLPFAVTVMSQYIKWFYLKYFSNMDEHRVVGCLSQWHFMLQRKNKGRISPANLHPTNFSTITITYHPGLVQ